MYFGVYFTIFSYKQSASIKALLKFQTNFKKSDKYKPQKHSKLSSIEWKKGIIYH